MRAGLLFLGLCAACSPVTGIAPDLSDADYFAWVRVGAGQLVGSDLMPRSALTAGFSAEDETLFLVGYRGEDLEVHLPTDLSMLRGASLRGAQRCEPELPVPRFTTCVGEGCLPETRLGSLLTAPWLEARCPVASAEEVAVELLCEENFSPRVTQPGDGPCRFLVDFTRDNRDSIELRVDALGRTCVSNGAEAASWQGDFLLDGCAAEGHLVPADSLPVEIERHRLEEIISGPRLPALGLSAEDARRINARDFGLARDVLRVGSDVVVAARGTENCSGEAETQLWIRGDDGRVSTATTSSCVVRLAEKPGSSASFYALVMPAVGMTELQELDLSGRVSRRVSIPLRTPTSPRWSTLIAHADLVTSFVTTSTNFPTEGGLGLVGCIASFFADDFRPVKAPICSTQRGMLLMSPRPEEGRRLEVIDDETDGVFVLDPITVAPEVVSDRNNQPGITHAQFTRPRKPGFAPSVGGFFRGPPDEARYFFGFEEATGGGVLVRFVESASGVLVQSFMIGPWLPTAAVVRGRSILMIGSMLDGDGEVATHLLRYDSDSGRFSPKRTRLGAGTAIRVRVEPDGALLVLLAEAGELIRVRVL